MAPMLGVIQSEVANEPSQDWVVELGTNDQRIGNGSWATTFGNEAAALQTQHCVIFVTINPTLGTIAAGINGAIDTAVASHANFHALDRGTVACQSQGTTPLPAAWDHIASASTGQRDDPGARSACQVRRRRPGGDDRSGEVSMTGFSC